MGGGPAGMEAARVAAERGLKVIMDMVFNHCGTGHWWIKDLPDQIDEEPLQQPAL